MLLATWHTDWASNETFIGPHFSPCFSRMPPGLIRNTASLNCSWYAEGQRLFLQSPPRFWGEKNTEIVSTFLQSVWMDCKLWVLQIANVHSDRLVKCAQFCKIVPTVQFIFLPLSFRIMTTGGIKPCFHIIFCEKTAGITNINGCKYIIVNLHKWISWIHKFFIVAFMH